MFASTVATTVSSLLARGLGWVWSYRVNQIYPLVSLAIGEFSSDVVLDVLSRSIRSLPLSCDLFRLCTGNSVETR